MTSEGTSLPFGEASDAKYVQLTTYRKDGTPVATPIWAVREGDTLYMWTAADSWKVKRLRRDPRVQVQACDARGKTLYGNAVAGSGVVLDDAGTDRVRDLIVKKYGILGRLTILGSRLRRGNEGTIGLAITPAS